MWKDKLEAIKQKQKLYGEKVNSGITKEEATAFRKEAKEVLHVSPPDEYINILKTVNGIEFNGFILYGADESLLHKAPNQYVNGFIDNNETWLENDWEKQYIFIGDSNISWYAYDLAGKKYYELDKPSGRECEEFDSLEKLFEKILSDSLL